jgi:predicted transcriptional regulator
MSADRTVLLSLRPRFAEALLNGTKSVEVRRRPVRLSPGAVCLVYASSPARALTGAVVVETIDVADPDILWRRHGAGTAVQRWEYDTYLAGRPVACAIVVAAAIAFRTPVPLDELRRRRHAFAAPQSYRFLRAGELAALLNGQAADLHALAGATARRGLPTACDRSFSPLHGALGQASSA